MVNFIEKNLGGSTIEILTSSATLLESFLNIERAGRTCYQTEINEITLMSAKKFIKKIIKLGHFSVIEHSNLTVKFNNVSRCFTHSIVRNRLCTFSQQSTVHALNNDNELKVIIPPNFNMQEHYLIDDLASKEGFSLMTGARLIGLIEAFYQKLRSEGYSTLQARYFLPLATVNAITMTANFRQWRHIFEMRTTAGEDWENRLNMVNLLIKLQNIIPVIFDDFEQIDICPFEVPIYKCKYGS